jgi:hypothetical protein
MATTETGLLSARTARATAANPRESGRTLATDTIIAERFAAALVGHVCLGDLEFRAN